MDIHKFINNICIQTSKSQKTIVMKKRTYIIAFHFILLAACSFYFTSCGKDGSDTLTQLSADEAKVEIRAGNQEIMQALEEIMNSEAFVALNFLSQLGNAEFTIKSDLMPALTEIEERKVRPYLRTIAEKYALAGEPDPGEGGEWHYNFDTQVFDLINPDLPYLKVLYPADEQDYNMGQRNAELIMKDYEFYVDDYGDEVPTNFYMELNLHGALAMSLNYTASFDADGMPLSMAIDMEMPPYAMSMSQSETATKSESHMDFRKNNEILFSYNIAADIGPNNEILTVSGHLQVTPLKFDGYMHEANMYECGEDIDCMNENMDVKVILTTQNALIGHLEFRMFTYNGESGPALVVVYEDDSWEWLDDIFDMDFEL